MAKVAKPKQRPTSVRSRAHRRAESPERSLNNNKPKSISKDDTGDSWIYAAQSTGVHKKAPKAKKLTRQQRQRQLKALEHADRNVDKLEKKVKDSKARSGRVQARRKEWEEVNGVKPAAATDGKADAVKAPEDVKAGAMEVDDEWEDEDEPVREQQAGTIAMGESGLPSAATDQEVEGGATVDNDIDQIG